MTLKERIEETKTADSMAKALVRLDYLHRVALGIDELTDERDLQKSEMELYEQWRKEHKNEVR